MYEGTCTSESINTCTVCTRYLWYMMYECDSFSIPTKNTLRSLTSHISHLTSHIVSDKTGKVPLTGSAWNLLSHSGLWVGGRSGTNISCLVFHGWLSPVAFCRFNLCMAWYDTVEGCGAQFQFHSFSSTFFDAVIHPCCCCCCLLLQSSHPFWTLCSVTTDAVKVHIF